MADYNDIYENSLQALKEMFPSCEEEMIIDRLLNNNCNIDAAAQEILSNSLNTGSTQEMIDPRLYVI